MKKMTILTKSEEKVNIHTSFMKMIFCEIFPHRIMQPVDRDKVKDYFTFKTKKDLLDLDPWINLRQTREKMLEAAEWLEAQPDDLPFN